MRKIIILAALGPFLAGCAAHPPQTTRDANLAAMRAAEPAYEAHLAECLAIPDPMDCIKSAEVNFAAEAGLTKPAMLSAYLANLKALYAEVAANPATRSASVARAAQMRAGYLAAMANPDY